MTKQTAKMTVRGLMVAAGAWMLMLVAGMPAGAVVTIDETVNVAGPTPSGVIGVAGEEVEIPGAKDVSVRIQATQALAEPLTVGTTGHQKCTLMDKAFQLNLDAGAAGSVTVKYTVVDGKTGAETLEDEVIPFGPTPAHSQEIVKICLR